MTDFNNVTTADAVNTYNSASSMFSALLREVRELSKKKPDATLSASKVKLINAVLNDLLTFLGKEPEGKYLQAIDDDALPQVSDALMMMVQFAAALQAFHNRYFRVVRRRYSPAKHHWITIEQINQWHEEDTAVEIEDDDEDIGEI